MRQEDKICAIILPYFGKFNNYFELFLKSCSFNTKFQWFVFTDSDEEYHYPSNVCVIKMTLQDVKRITEKKLGFSIQLDTPYKLCDYKPAYGFIFEEYIEGYRYWAHCDCDLLFGNLEKLLLPILEEGYDKIFAAGHLTIYKNTMENNRRFQGTYKGERIFEKAFTTDTIYVFDEDCRYDHNIHSIFLEQNARIYSEDLSMNPSVYSAKFIRSSYSQKDRDFVQEKYIPARYYWHEGNVISLFNDNGNIIRREYTYIHLQMRKMRINQDVFDANTIQILPDRFRAEKKLPMTTKELKEHSIGFPYLYWLDVYKKKIKRRLKL